MVLHELEVDGCWNKAARILNSVSPAVSANDRPSDSQRRNNAIDPREYAKQRNEAAESLHLCSGLSRYQTDRRPR